MVQCRQCCFSVCVFICAFLFVCMSPFFYVSLSSWGICLTVFGASVTNLNEPPIYRALAASTIIVWVSSSILGRCKQKQCGLKRGLLCHWPSITEWEVHKSLLRAPAPSPKWPIYCVEWDVKLYYTIPYLAYFYFYCSYVFYFALRIRF